jgi:hypothetical protein
MRPTFAGPGSSTGNYKPTSDPGKQVGAFQMAIHSEQFKKSSLSHIIFS